MFNLPISTREEQERNRYKLRGQFLARQERWHALARAMQDADQTRDTTPGAIPIADLLSSGARGDVVRSVEHALYDGRPVTNAPLLDGIEALEAVLAQDHHDCMLSIVLAQTHLDIARLWSGTTPSECAQRFVVKHLRRADEILAPFNTCDTASPALAAIRCAIASARHSEPRTLAKAYDTLIALNPANAGAIRAFGRSLAAHEAVTPDRMGQHAQEVAGRTRATWGVGGYTWVMFDAVAHNDAICASLDVDLFLAGLKDILLSAPTQFTVNMLAAFCANMATSGPAGTDATAQASARIAWCAGGIVRDHLRELHPVLWDPAAAGFDIDITKNIARRLPEAGKTRALRILAEISKSEIAVGKMVAFTGCGPTRKPHHPFGKVST